MVSIIPESKTLNPKATERIVNHNSRFQDPHLADIVLAPSSENLKELVNLTATGACPLRKVLRPDAPTLRN